MASPHFHLLRLPYDIRRLIYGFYYPVAKQIRLTSGPVSKNKTHKGFTICRLSSEAINLMRVCRQMNGEITAMLYGTNRFFMVPSEPHTRETCQVSLHWLHHMRSSTKQMVKKLYIRVELPMSRSCITSLISGVSAFPTLEIGVAQHLFVLEEGEIIATYEESASQLTEICNRVMKTRGSAQTTWNDMGKHSTKMYFFLEHIIGTYEEVGKTWQGRRGMHRVGRWTISGDEWTKRQGATCATTTV